MSRRWKVIFALGVVGLGGFLVWAFLSEPHHDVALRFMGYKTNAALYKVVEITARFCLTNGSQRVIYCESVGGVPSCRVESKTSEGWFFERGPVGDGSSVAGIILVSPGKTTCFTLDVLSPERPLRVTMAYSTNHFPGVFRLLFGVAPKPAAPPFLVRFKNRVSSWIRRDKEDTSVSITIQER